MKKVIKIKSIENVSLVIKDADYYYDLIYELKRICGLLRREEINSEIEKRIKARIAATTKVIYQKPLQEYRFSTFNQDLLEALRKISFKHYDELSQIYRNYSAIRILEQFRYNDCLKYAKEVIDELEQKRQSLEIKTPKSKKRIISNKS